MNILQDYSENRLLDFLQGESAQDNQTKKGKVTLMMNCEGQCCQPLDEKLAVYVNGVTGTLRLCTTCAEMLGPPISDKHLQEYQLQFAHFKKTGEYSPTPSELSLQKRIKNLSIKPLNKYGDLTLSDALDTAAILRTKPRNE